MGLKAHEQALREHPQVSEKLFYYKAHVFTCPQCGDMYTLSRAKMLADKTLVCLWCAKDGDLIDRGSAWCPGCGEILPVDAFERGRDRHVRCNDCTSARSTRSVTVTCCECGDVFTARRSDARFCSSRCRVRAHRRK